MKKVTLFFITIILLIVLGACSKDLTKEELISEMNEQADEVENYHTIIDFEVEATSGDEENKSIAKTDTDVIESTDELAGTVTSEQAGEQMNMEFYLTKDDAIANMDGTGWESVPNEPDQILDDKAYYKHIRKMIDTIRDDLDMELKDDAYVLTFKGKSQDVFDAFEGPYHLSVNGIGEDEMEHDVIIKINKETFHIEHVENILTGESNQGKLVISVKHDYSDIGDIKSIKIPEEITEKVKGR